MSIKKLALLLSFSALLVLGSSVLTANAASLGEVENFHYQNYYGFGPYWSSNYGTTYKYINVRNGYLKTSYTKTKVTTLGPLTYKYRFTANYKIW